MRLRLGVFGLFAVFFVTSGPSTYADVPRSSDGNGVVVGSAAAPVRSEIFIEPQCPHVAQLESADGDRIADEIGDGQLSVTYRPLTFLDGKHDNDVSARISNALFLAADPATPATAYQAFVQELYRHQSPDGPANTEIAAMAHRSGIPDPVAARIAAGDPVVDVTAMDNANTVLLTQENPQGRITPTVYNPDTGNVVDLQDPDWIEELVG